MQSQEEVTSCSVKASLDRGVCQVRDPLRSAHAPIVGWAVLLDFKLSKTGSTKNMSFFMLNR